MEEVSNINNIKELLSDLNLEMPNSINQKTLYCLLSDIADGWIEFKNKHLTTEIMVMEKFIFKCTEKDKCCLECEKKPQCTNNCFSPFHDKAFDCEDCPKK